MRRCTAFTEWFAESTVTRSPQQRPHPKGTAISQTPENISAITPPPPPADLNRRTILQGAAWTIPAIAVATVAPAAAAASNTALLTFNQNSYSGTACSTITGAYVTVNVNGTPTAGRSVTTTLSGGYTFAGGATTNTQVSGTDGRVNLPEINVPYGTSTGTLTSMTSGASTTSATLSGAGTPVYATGRDGNGFFTQWRSIPATAKPTDAWGRFLDGTDLWKDNTKVDTGVTKIAGNTNGGVGWVQYLKGSTWIGRDSQGYSQTFPSIPLTATPTNSWGWFVDGTNLWYQTDIVDTGVSGVQGGTNGQNWVQYRTGGTWYGRDNSGYVKTFSQVPASATATRSFGWFVDGSDLWHDEDLVEKNVSKVVGNSPTNSNWVVYLQGGSWFSRIDHDAPAAFPTTPATATATRGWGWFVDGTNVWSGGQIVDTGASYVAGGTSGTLGWVQYIDSTPC